MRRQREDKLFSELDKTKQELETLRTAAMRISDNGWDMGTLINTKVNQESENNQFLQMQQKIDKMESRLTQKEAEIAQLARDKRLSEVQAYVAKNSNDYEFLLLHNSEHKILDLIDDFYTTHKKLLTVPEAAKALEQQYEQFEENKAQKVALSEKGKKIYKTALGDVVKTVSKKTEKEPETVANVPNKPESIAPPVAKKPEIVVQRTHRSNIAHERSTTVSTKPQGLADRQAALNKIIAQYGNRT